MTGHWRSFLRFVMVGGGVSLTYAVATAALIRYAAAPPFLTSLVIYVICIPLAYLLHKTFAFGIEKTRKSAFLIYAATQVVGLAAVSAVTTIFVTHDFWRDTGLLLVTSALAAVASFLIGRFVTFRPAR